MWVGGKDQREKRDEVSDAMDAGEARKIASVGVHLRRYVSSYGIALNVDTDLRWFERIMACGLPGKRATSMQRELRGASGHEHPLGEGVPRIFEEVMVQLLPGVETAQIIEENEVLALDTTGGGHGQ